MTFVAKARRWKWSGVTTVNSSPFKCANVDASIEKKAWSCKKCTSLKRDKDPFMPSPNVQRSPKDSESAPHTSDKSSKPAPTSKATDEVKKARDELKKLTKEHQTAAKALEKQKQAALKALDEQETLTRLASLKTLQQQKRAEEAEEAAMKAGKECQEAAIAIEEAVKLKTELTIQLAERDAELADLRPN